MTSRPATRLGRWVDQLSLQTRLVAVLLVLVTVTVTFTGFAATAVLRDDLIDGVDRQLAAVAGQLLRGPVGGPLGPRLRGRGGGFELPSTFVVEYRDLNGVPLASWPVPSSTTRRPSCPG